MKTYQVISISSTMLLALLAVSRDGRAITLPDNSSGPCTGSQDPCFEIPSTVTGGTALWGNATGTGTTYGVYGYGFYGVKGQAVTGSAGYGVKGEGDSSGGGVGVWGSAKGAGYGVYGTTNSATGYGGYFDNTGGGTYALYVHGGGYSTTSFISASDVRLKKDIKDAAYGLSEVLKLRPVMYRWKDTGLEKGIQIGLIAQEVEKIIPEVVHDGADGTLGIRYSDLIPVAIKAVQEQESVILRQEARIAMLEKERKPVLSSFFTGSVGEGLTLGLLPLGLVVAYGRRKRQSSERDDS